MRILSAEAKHVKAGKTTLKFVSFSHVLHCPPDGLGDLDLLARHLSDRGGLCPRAHDVAFLPSSQLRLRAFKALQPALEYPRGFIGE